MGTTPDELDLDIIGLVPPVLADDPLMLPDESPDLAAQLPPLILAGLRAYALEHRPTGNFILAVLSNDLFEAVCHADVDSLAAIRPIVLYVYNCLPRNCWGSPEKVAAWLNGGNDASL